MLGYLFRKNILHPSCEFNIDSDNLQSSSSILCGGTSNLPRFRHFVGQPFVPYVNNPTPGHYATSTITLKDKCISVYQFNKLLLADPAKIKKTKIFTGRHSCMCLIL